MRYLLVLSLLSFGTLLAQEGGLSPRDMYYHPVRPVVKHSGPGDKSTHPATNPKGTDGGGASKGSTGKPIGLGGADLVPVAEYFGP